jgi:hypothetical protein
MAKLRHALVAAAALLALACGAPAATPQTPPPTVTIRAGKPTPDPEDTNRLGRRFWDVRFQIEVSGAACPRPRVRYAYGVLFDRRTTEQYSGEAFPTDAPGTYTTFVGVQIPGSVIRFTASARCTASEPAATAETRVRVPPQTCNAGPIAVRALRGRAWREHVVRTNFMVTVAKGDLILTAYSLWVGRGARLVLGDPACDGLLYRIDGPMTGVSGNYDRLGRGDSFLLDSGRVLARGDRHAGGVATWSATAQPLGSRPSVYEVTHEPAAGAVRPRVRVRVLRGAVRVRPLASRSSVVVRAGHQVRVACSAPTACAAERPQRFR